MKQALIALASILLFTYNELYAQEPSPTIVYSTYYGHMGTDDADAVAVDIRGNTYLGCHSNSINLPSTGKHPYTPSGGMDAFIIKLNHKGSEIDYLTQLGGSKWDAVQGLIADSIGNIYAIGTTYSSDFPIHPNGFQSKFGGKSDAFVLKLDTHGKVVWSTFIGGSQDEDGRDIVLDRQGNIHIIGRTASKDFPALPGALQSRSAGGVDAFVATLDPQGNMLTTTYLGGSGNDIGFSIKLDHKGRRYIAGTTNSSDFPTKNAFQETNHGKNDLFLAVIDTNGSTLEFSSYLGGKGADQVYSIDLGASGDVFIMGVTDSADLPTTSDAFQSKFAGVRDVFVARVDLGKKKTVYATYLGGKNVDTPRNLVVDDKDNAFIIGQTSSTDFPIKNSQQTPLKGRSDAFVTQLDPSGSFLVHSALFGGNGTEIFEGAAFGDDGSLTVSGLSDSLDFPTKNPLQNRFLGGRFDIVVMRFLAPK